MSTLTQFDITTTPYAETHTEHASSTRQSVWKHGVAAAVVASVATTVLAVVASAAGVSFADSTGESIPVFAFPQLTVVFSLVGTAIASAMARKARRPRRTFVRTTVALTALSYVPDLTFGFGAASAATLITLHTVAAFIVVPALARRLVTTR
jgi:amino acid transporter